VAKLKRRERNVFLECTECKSRNYVTPFRAKGGGKLELSKFCPTCGKHVSHKSRKVD
jgi:large subunit ribosomal protein L33